MERFTHSLKILWRTERLLTERQLQLASQRMQFNALAALAALFGLGMVSIGAYFALVPSLGQSGAAFAVGCADFALAGTSVFIFKVAATGAGNCHGQGNA